MSSYVIPLFPAAAVSPLPTRDAVAAELSRLRDRVDASLPGKADKAPPSASGNLASLGADGNLLDSGTTPASIKAAAVAEVVANAPGTMDTLKEIADILGSSQESGTVLKRISDLEIGKAPAQHVHSASQITSGELSADRIPGLPASKIASGTFSVARIPGLPASLIVSGTFSAARIPDLSATKITSDTFSAARIPGLPASKITSGTIDAARLPSATASERGAVTVDATLAQQGAAADAKAVGDALRGGFTEWEFSGDGYTEGHTYTIVISSSEEGYYDYMLYDNGTYVDLVTLSTDSSIEIYFSTENITATRHLVTPTKTSQLVNDGDGANAFVKTDDTRLSDARTPTAHHATHAANGSDPLAPADIGAASLADLPYRLVEPGKWEFRGLSGDEIGTAMSYMEGEGWTLYLSYEGGESDAAGPVSGADSDLVVEFAERNITAQRASLPGHLLDRAGNRVVVSGDTTLTLPALEHAGRLRDFLVRLEISGSTVPTITFAAPTGETITYETDGDEFPVPDEAGTWSYSFTENCVAHTFAVSLKKVHTVAQGGA